MFKALIGVHFFTCIKTFLKPGQICPGTFYISLIKEVDRLLPLLIPPGGLPYRLNPQ